MKYLLIVFIFILGLFSLGFDINDEVKATHEVRGYIEWFHQNVHEKYKNRAWKLAPIVVHYAGMYRIDHLLVAVFISCESSWKWKSIGKKGEIGLLQVHWYEAKKGFDLSKPEDQIHAGVKWMRHCFDACDQKLDCALNLYATGSKRKKWKKLDRRLRLYREAVRRHRTHE